jgi:hypothetical protein
LFGRLTFRSDLNRSGFIVFDRGVYYGSARDDARPCACRVRTAGRDRPDNDDAILFHGRFGSLDLDANEISDRRRGRDDSQLFKLAIRQLENPAAFDLELDAD